MKMVSDKLSRLNVPNGKVGPPSRLPKLLLTKKETTEAARESKTTTIWISSIRGGALSLYQSERLRALLGQPEITIKKGRRGHSLSLWTSDSRCHSSTPWKKSGYFLCYGHVIDVTTKGTKLSARL